MEQKSVVIEIPAVLYERIQKEATENNQTAESLIANHVTAFFIQTPEDTDAVLALLGGYSNLQLWSVVGQQMSWPEKARMDALETKGEVGQLSADEQQEIEKLLDKVDEYTLLRSAALVLLKERGEDVERLLESDF